MKNLSDSRVLIVDDVKDNIDVLVNALRDDYKLSVALDGTAALRSAEKWDPLESTCRHASLSIL